MAQQPPTGPPEGWQPPAQQPGWGPQPLQPYSTQPMPRPLTDDERRSWLAQQVDEHLRTGWQVESRTDNLVSLRRGRPINHVLHLILTLLTCFAWALVWIGLAIFAGEKHKTISTQDADRRPQVEGQNTKTILIAVGAVFAFLVVMAIVGSFLPE